MIPDPLGGSTTVPTGPPGTRISLTNEMLSVSVKNVYIQSMVQQGVPATAHVGIDGP